MQPDELLQMEESVSVTSLVEEFASSDKDEDDELLETGEKEEAGSMSS